MRGNERLHPVYGEDLVHTIDVVDARDDASPHNHVLQHEFRQRETGDIESALQLLRARR